MSPLARGLVNMELHRGDGSLGTFLGVQSGLAMKSIDVLGSEEQKERWLPAMARLDKIGAFALTEPMHGSDSVAPRRRARGATATTGCSTAPSAGSATGRSPTSSSWARSDEDGQVKGFVEREGMASATTMEGKGAARARSGRPTSARRRARARGLAPAGRAELQGHGRVLVTTRTTCAWGGARPRRRGVRHALTYSKQRKQFGKPLCSFQIVQERLVRMLAEVTSMQLYLHAARAPGGDRPAVGHDRRPGEAQQHPQGAREVIASARDMLGGNGVLLENHVIRHMGDIEVIHTYEGTETMQTLIVGRDITGVGAFA